MIQLLIRHVCPPTETSTQQETKSNISDELSSHKEEVQCESKYYKIGDFVDVIDVEYGSWVEAVIMDIAKKSNIKASDEKGLEAELIFKIAVDR